MTEKQDPKEPLKPELLTDKLEKNGKIIKPLAHLEAKRAQNLRDNLLKRKAQQRARQTDN